MSTLRPTAPAARLTREQKIPLLHAILQVAHPYTEYRRRGWAWRLPGQIEHGDLPETTREAFHELAFRHLEAYNARYLTFNIGRFERPQRDWNRKTLPTPLATFLRSKAWIAAGKHHEPGFRKASECWASRTRQGRPPRFLERVSDTVAGLVEGSEELAELVFGNALGLRDWHSPDTAPQRLRALSVVAPALATHDRRDFRNEYRRAWLDLSDTGSALPLSLNLAVSRDGRLETLCGNAESPPTVIVTQNARAFEARILSSAGHALLDIGEASGEKIADRLAATGRFRPRQLDGIGVRLLVDGEPFVPRTSDPLLTSFELGWLPEVVLLGHEILADRLERGVHRVTVERRLRAIRVRRCHTIRLVVVDDDDDEEEDTPPQDSMECYGVEHLDLPTLILSDRVPIAWPTLARDLSRTVARLIDPRLRFLEPLLLRLALDQDSDALEAPGDEALTVALGCDSRTLQDLRAALRTDLGHVLHLLTGRRLLRGRCARRTTQERCGTCRDRFDLLRWLRSQFPLREPAPHFAACGHLAALAERASTQAFLVSPRCALNVPGPLSTSCDGSALNSRFGNPHRKN